MNDVDGYLEPAHFEKTIEWYYAINHLRGMFGAPLDGKREVVGDAIINDGIRFVLIEFKRGKEELVSEKNKYPYEDWVQAENLKNKLPHISLTQEEIDKKNEFIVKSNNSLEKFNELKLMYAVSASYTPEKIEGLQIPPHVLVYGNYVDKEIMDGKIRKVLDNLKTVRYWAEWCNELGSGNAGKIKDVKDYQENISNINTKLGCNAVDFEIYIVKLIEAKGGNKEAAKGLWKYSNVVGVMSAADDSDVACAVTLWEFAEKRGMNEVCEAFAKAHEAEAILKASLVPKSKPKPPGS